MRGVFPALAAGVLGCTAPNPEFGDTGGAEATTSPTSGMTATETTATATTTTATTIDTSEPTTDPATESSATEPGTASLGDESSSTTGAPANHCCGVDDCDDPIRECLCELDPENCCSAADWAPTCPGIAIACGGSCNGEVFPCCVPHPEPACTGVALLPGFCLAHAECCLLEWTPSCVHAYDLTTRECGLEACDAPHSSPGCDDPDLMECVCTEEGQTQCCTEAWDAACADLAAGC